MSKSDSDKRRPLSRFALIAEWGERVFILVLYGWLIHRMVEPCVTSGDWGSLLLLPAEGIVVILILIRHSTENISRRPLDWLLALGGTTAVLLVNPVAEWSLVPVAVGGVLILMGMLVQLHAKIVLGRSMGLVAAKRKLKFAGPYRFVRHPMYCGYLITHVGFLLLNPSFWNVGVYVLAYGLQIPRLLAEERYLRTDPAYAEYMEAVRYRLIPGIF